MSERETTTPKDSGGEAGDSPNKPIGHELVGQIINGRFKILSVLDHGGMGVIYRAEQVPLGRIIAVKVLLPSMLRAADTTFRDRFFLEASTCARFKHPNTVTIHDFGEFDNGAYFIAMELLEGRSLKTLIQEEGPLPAARVLHILRQICGSLQEAHSQGIIHRDIKPANIFMVQRGDDTDFAKVLDFGLVKELSDSTSELTQQGSMIGSPRFMPPEQIRAENVDARSDIYSLGAVLYYALTGEHLFAATDSFAIVMAHVNDQPRAFADLSSGVHIPPSIEKMVMTCLAKDPAHRYQNLGELMAAANAAAQELGLSPGYASGSFSGDSFATLVSTTPAGVVAAQSDTSTPAAAGAQGRGMGIAIGIGLLAVVAAVLFAITGSRHPSGEEDLPQIAPGDAPKTTILVTNPPEPTAQHQSLSINISTTPEGAALFRDGADLGDAPIELTIPEGEQWEIEARLPGYTPRTISVQPGQHTVNIALKPIPRAKPKPKVAEPKPSAVKRLRSFIEKKTDKPD